MERIFVDCAEKGCRHAVVWVCWGPAGGRPQRACSKHLAQTVAGLLIEAGANAGVKVQRY